MPIVKKTEQFPERPVVILLVGTPFSRKTSLANTAKNPILVDADRGADRSYGRPDTFVIKEGWGELETEDNAGLFTGYDTAILDTAKAILDDFLMEYVISKNYKLRTNKMQMFGAIGDEFKLFINKRRASNMDIIIIAHDKTKDDDGVNVINPDITGGSKNLILRIADQVGYVSNKRIKRGENMVDIVTVNFNPNETTPFCKNVANLQEIELPHYSDPRWKDFMEREIIQPTKDAISKMTDEQRAALSFISDWHTAIEAIVPADYEDEAKVDTVLKDTLNKIVEIPEEHIKKQIRSYFSAHIGKIGWGWDKDATPAAFKPKTVSSPATPAIQPAEEKKPVSAETLPPPVVVDETKPAITPPNPTTPMINKNPHTAKPDPNDLFAKAKES